MKKLIIIFIIILILAAGIFYLLTNILKGPASTPTESPSVSQNIPNQSTSSQQSQSTSSLPSTPNLPTVPTSSPTNPSQPNLPQPKTVTVLIQNFAFNPAVLNIKIGDNVIWQNKDAVPHQIKADSFNSAVLNQGDKFEFSFDTVGVYNYSCAIHPSMKGQIIVTK